LNNKKDWNSEESPWLNSDIDFFLVGSLTPEEAERKVRKKIPNLFFSFTGPGDPLPEPKIEVLDFFLHATYLK
jgi:hypothetical protein